MADSLDQTLSPTDVLNPVINDMIKDANISRSKTTAEASTQVPAKESYMPEILPITSRDIAFGGAGLTAGFLAAYFLKKYFGRDTSSRRLKNATMEALEDVMSTVKDVISDRSINVDLSLIGDAIDLRRKKDELKQNDENSKKERSALDKQIKEVENSAEYKREVEEYNQASIFKRPKNQPLTEQLAQLRSQKDTKQTEKVQSEEKIKDLDRKLREMETSRDYLLQENINTILTKVSEKVVVPLDVVKVPTESFKGNEEKLGIVDVEGKKHIELNNIVYRGKYYVDGADFVDFELKLVPDQRMTVESRKAEAGMEMKYGISMTVFSPVRFPRHVKGEGEGIVTDCNRDTMKVSDASFHYVDSESAKHEFFLSTKDGNGANGYHPAYGLIKNSLEECGEFFVVTNKQSKHAPGKYRMNVATVVSSHRGATRIDMLEKTQELYTEAEIEEPLNTMNIILHDFISPLLKH